MLIASTSFFLASVFCGWRAVMNSDEYRDIKVFLYLLAFWICFVLGGVFLLAAPGVHHA